MRRLTTLGAFGLAAVASWIGLGSYGLVEPSDARYAEIAREMLISRNYLFPQLLGIHHLHEPPFVCWLSATGLGWLGIDEWGARACLGVTALLLALVLWRFARRHLGVRSGSWAVAIAATTPALIGAGRLLDAGLLLTLCLTMALTSWYDNWSGKGGRRTLALFYGSMGFVLLAGGPVAWVLLASVLVSFCLLRRGSGKRRRVPWGLRWGLPAALVPGLAWHGYFAAQTGSLLSSLPLGELASRPHSWLYYTAVLPALGLPWLLFAPSGWVRCRERTPPLATFLGLWTLISLLLSILPAARFPFQALPAYSALALLAAVALSGDQEAPSGPLQAAAWLILALGIVLGLFGLGVVPLRGGGLTPVLPGALGRLFLPASLASLVAGITALFQAKPNPGRAAAFLAACLAFLPAWTFSQGNVLPLRSVRTVALAARSELRHGDLFVEYGNLIAGVPFYSGRIPLLVGQRGEEHRFQEGSRESPTMSTGKLRRLWAGPGRILVVITGEDRGARLPGARELARGGGYALLANR